MKNVFLSKGTRNNDSHALGLWCNIIFLLQRMNLLSSNVNLKGISALGLNPVKSAESEFFCTVNLCCLLTWYHIILEMQTERNPTKIWAIICTLFNSNVNWTQKKSG